MNKLIVRHLDGSNPPQFQVVRLSDGKSIGPITVPSPVGFPVEGMPNSHLMRELRWYLETFLDYPFPPFTDRAERIQSSLRAWGTGVFEALFDDCQSGRLFDAATDGKYSNLHLEISSDDPKILYWPWEALRDGEAGALAQTCQISRRLNKVRDPHPLSNQLPRDRINILLVTARPYESDVRFRSISRPLLELIARDALPAHVTLLRPPTFDQLRLHLRQHPNHYHILHFDGHGAYGDHHGHHDPHSLTLQGPQGELVFEDDNGQPDPQKASVLSELLRDYNVPVVVLNACQSAMVDDTADDALASVAAGLQKSGVRSVVAMAYSLYVSGAQQFLPAFYRRLFETGQVADAVRAGRQQTVAHPHRICARGLFPLDDWLVPVLYEQQAVDLSFAEERRLVPSAPETTLPADAHDDANPYGLIGRDGALLAMERAIHRPPAGILIHGLGGIGKTTLARGFVHWLATTGGLGEGCCWFSFQEIRSAEFVINELVGALFGTSALAATPEKKFTALIAALRDHRFVIVWDNFEVVSGIEGTTLQPTLSADDRRLLLKLLQGLRGGASKVLITSRSREDWLDTATCYRLPVGGLHGEERWEYCDAIVRDQGLIVDRSRPDWIELMNLLDGHPLAMRVILPHLQLNSPLQLTTALKANLLKFASQDAESAKLFATLRFVEEGLPQPLLRLLIPLALHDRFVDADDVKQMGAQAAEPVDERDVDRLLHALNVAGLLQDRGNGIHEMHPALGRYLHLTVFAPASEIDRDQWCRLFVDRMARIADYWAPKQLHEQRPVFHLHGSNFRRALAEAERLAIDEMLAALIQSLAAFAQHTRNFREAAALFLRLARASATYEAGAYHQLGIIAQEQRDYATAEQWYRKSLAIKEKQGNEHGAASTYHQLGIIAQEQRDYATAEQWYRKSLAIDEKQGNEHGAASTYHQLGRIAEEQRDYATAGDWSIKAIRVFMKLDPHSAQIALRVFLEIYHAADSDTQTALKAKWQAANLGPFPATNDSED